MKVCNQCASLTNRPEKVNGEIVCQECYKKLTVADESWKTELFEAIIKMANLNKIID